MTRPKVDITGSGEAFFVRYQGVIVSARATGYENACIAANRIEAQLLLQDRRCICCGTTFPSTGRHHRMCDPCRTHAAGIAA